MPAGLPDCPAGIPGRSPRGPARRAQGPVRGQSVARARLQGRGLSRGRRRGARHAGAPLRRLRRAFRRGGGGGPRGRLGAGYDADAGPGARLLHADRVRVRQRRAAGGWQRPAGDPVRRRPLRRARRSARRAAGAGRWVRDGPRARLARRGRRRARAADRAAARCLRGRDRGCGSRGRPPARRGAPCRGPGGGSCVRGSSPQGAAEDGRPRRRANRRDHRRAGARRRHRDRASDGRRPSDRRAAGRARRHAVDRREDRRDRPIAARDLDAQPRMRGASRRRRRARRHVVRLGCAPSRPRGGDLHRPARPRGCRPGRLPSGGGNRGARRRAGPARGVGGAGDGHGPSEAHRDGQPRARHRRGGGGRHAPSRCWHGPTRRRS